MLMRRERGRWKINAGNRVKKTKSDARAGSRDPRGPVASAQTRYPSYGLTHQPRPESKNPTDPRPASLVQRTTCTTQPTYTFLQPRPAHNPQTTRKPASDPSTCASTRAAAHASPCSCATWHVYALFVVCRHVPVDLHVSLNCMLDCCA